MDIDRARDLINGPMCDTNYVAVSMALGSINQYEYFWFEDYYYVAFNSACKSGIIFG